MQDMYLKLNYLVSDIRIHLLTITLHTLFEVFAKPESWATLIKEARSLFKLTSEEKVRYYIILPTTGLQQLDL